MSTTSNDNMPRNIKEIAPVLAYYIVDIENEALTFDENNNLIAANIQRLGLFHKYLELLHDSQIIKINITADTFSITLNDFTTHVFSDVIVEKKKLDIEHEKLVFPLQLDFETLNLTYNRVDLSGNIYEIEPTTINEYLYEQVISIDKDKIDIGLILWKDGVNGKQGQYILILMSVKNITLTELQDKAWTEIFGNAYDNYYKYFKNQLATGRYLSDQPSCYTLYDEFEGQLNN